MLPRAIHTQQRALSEIYKLLLWGHTFFSSLNTTHFSTLQNINSHNSTLKTVADVNFVKIHFLVVNIILNINNIISPNCRKMWYASFRTQSACFSPFKFCRIQIISMFHHCWDELLYLWGKVIFHNAILIPSPDCRTNFECEEH